VEVVTVVEVVVRGVALAALNVVGLLDFGELLADFSRCSQCSRAVRLWRAARRLLSVLSKGEEGTLDAGEVSVYI